MDEDLHKVYTRSSIKYLRLKNTTENTIPRPSPVPAREKHYVTLQNDSCLWHCDEISIL